jgi:hypothetical protein
MARKWKIPTFGKVQTFKNHFSYNNKIDVWLRRAQKFVWQTDKKLFFETHKSGGNYLTFRLAHLPAFYSFSNFNFLSLSGREDGLGKAI